MRLYALPLLTVFLLAIPASADRPADFFESKIRPLLIKNCFSCHTSKKRGGLRLDSRAALLKGGDSGSAILPDSPEKSLLIKAVRYNHKDLKMPPKKALAAHEVADLVRWLKNGAVWPAGSGNPASVAAIERMRREFWSFKPVKRPAIPNVENLDWQKNPIDAFIYAKLVEKGLNPVRRADSRTLIRRATFDLIGLPPTPKEIESFLKVAGANPQAGFETLIDRLLKSRHYGERWGRHWLDLVRYADTAGDASDYPVPEAFQYRNYVIDAFNNDKPYDQFIREQIAGDLLTCSNEEERWRQLIATGYIAISRRIGVSPHYLRHITIEDTIDNLGKTFLGLTIGCARCHDHKFDPIPTEDYYSLYGIFDSTVYPHAGAEHKPYRSEFVYRIGKKRADKILAPFRKQLALWDRKERAKFEEYRSFQYRKITTPGRSREIAWKELLQIREQRRPVAEAFPDLEIAYAAQEGDPHDVHVQKAGDARPKSRGPLVRRGFLQVLGGSKLPDSYKGSGRRALADWIADPKNPLTARVLVNRIWHYHFGRGLVSTTSNFGIRGTPPTHPELLDFLATYFVEHGWSIKNMHRLIMSSQTYQLASGGQGKAHRRRSVGLDPENKLLWRANRRRLDAEQIRDSILTFSGKIDLTRGKRHPFPHRLTYFYRQHEPFQTPYPTNRRSIYVMQQRIQKNPYLDLFDGPDGNIPLAKRNATTTTLQALYLMNSKFMHAQSDAIAKRLSADDKDTAGRVQWAYHNIFGRPANAMEIRRAENYLQRATRLLGAAGDKTIDRRAWSGYIRGMISSNEFMFVE